MPATSPFPASILNKISARNQAVRWTTMLKEVRTFAAYCCDIDSDGIMGVKKQPVVVLEIDLSTCLGEATAWDFTASYAPGSTINSWEIDFGDGEPSETGTDIAAAAGTHTYAAIGSYTVTVTVGEGTGLSQTITRDIDIIDCPTPPPSWMYASTLGGGVWFIDWRETTPDWEARTNGISGTTALTVYSMAIKPGTKHTKNQELWITTQGGVYHSTKSGHNWERVAMGDPSNDEFGDIPPAVEDDLEWIHVAYSPIDENVIYILARKP